MANFYGHFTTSAVLAAGYGAAGVWYGHFDWGVVALASGLTTIGGLTPDLDSDNSTPVRELFALAGAVFPLFLIPRLRRMGLTLEEGLAIMIGAYLFIRYGLSYVLKRISVHRGMFHSIPALIISGLAVYNVYHHDDQRLRLYMAGGMMLGFLSHLVLDEVFAVDLRGLPRFKSSFGTALKLTSSSWRATTFCYFLLFLLGSMAWLEGRNEPRLRVEIHPQRQAKQRW